MRALKPQLRIVAPKKLGQRLDLLRVELAVDRVLDVDVVPRKVEQRGQASRKVQSVLGQAASRVVERISVEIGNSLKKVGT